MARMARTKSRTSTAIARRRSGPSPLVRKMQDQLAATRKRTAALARTVKESSSTGAAVKATGLSAAGGAVSGVVDHFIPNAVLSAGVRVAATGLLVVGGGYSNSKLGSAAVCAGAGMAADLAGQGTRALLSRFVG